eukprot:161490_1
MCYVFCVSDPIVSENYAKTTTRKEIILLTPGAEMKVTLWGRHAYRQIDAGDVLLYINGCLQINEYHDKLEISCNDQHGYVAVLKSVSDCKHQQIIQQYEALKKYGTDKKDVAISATFVN